MILYENRPKNIKGKIGNKNWQISEIAQPLQRKDVDEDVFSALTKVYKSCLCKGRERNLTCKGIMECVSVGIDPVNIVSGGSNKRHKKFSPKQIKAVVVLGRST